MCVREGREGRYQEAKRAPQPEVSARRAPRLLVLNKTYCLHFRDCETVTTLSLHFVRFFQIAKHILCMKFAISRFFEIVKQ